MELCFSCKQIEQGVICKGCHEAKVAELEAELSEAVKYLREGKRKFAPNTTNSDVDMFLKRYEKKGGLSNEKNIKQITWR